MTPPNLHTTNLGLIQLRLESRMNDLFKGQFHEFTTLQCFCLWKIWYLSYQTQIHSNNNKKISFFVNLWIREFGKLCGEQLMKTNVSKTWYKYNFANWLSHNLQSFIHSFFLLLQEFQMKNQRWTKNIQLNCYFHYKSQGCFKTLTNGLQFHFDRWKTKEKMCSQA